MRWNHYVSYFFGGIFLANAVPHLCNGLLCRVGRFDLRNNRHAISFGCGFLAISTMLAQQFGKFHGGLL